MDSLKEKKKILTLRIKNNIQNEDWKNLIPALPIAEEVQVSPALLKKAWILAGEYSTSKKDWTSAIIQFNKARVKSPSAIFVFDKLIQAFDSFYNQFKEIFSKKDLEVLRESLVLVVEYHRLNFPKHVTIVNSGNDLLQKIDYRIKYVAEDKVETAATFRVQEIYNAITDDMTMSEVRQEMAKTLTSIIRREQSNKKKKDKDKKKK